MKFGHSRPISKRQDRPRDDAHREQRDHHLRPALGQREVHGVARAVGAATRRTAPSPGRRRRSTRAGCARRTRAPASGGPGRGTAARPAAARTRAGGRRCLPRRGATRSTVRRAARARARRRRRRRRSRARSRFGARTRALRARPIRDPCRSPPLDGERPLVADAVQLAQNASKSTSPRPGETKSHRARRRRRGGGRRGWRAAVERRRTSLTCTW